MDSSRSTSSSGACGLGTPSSDPWARSEGWQHRVWATSTSPHMPVDVAQMRPGQFSNLAYGPCVGVPNHAPDEDVLLLESIFLRVWRPMGHGV